MILENLRDRFPTMFGPRTKHQIKMERLVALAQRRRLNLAGNVGTGLRRIAAARLEHYANGLRALVYHDQIIAEANRLQAQSDAVDQLAQTGGIETSP